MVIIWVFGISTYALLGAAIVFAAIAVASYELLCSWAMSIMEAMPVVLYVLWGLVLVGAVIYGICKQRILSGVLFALSWGSCALFVDIAIDFAMSIIVGSGNIIMLMTFGLIGIIISCGIPGFYVYIIMSAWNSEEEGVIWLATAGVWALILLLYWIC